MNKLTTAALRLPHAILQWWLAELIGLIPRSLRPSSTAAKRSLVIEIDGEEIVLSKHAGRQGVSELGRTADGQETAGEAVVGTKAFASLGERRYRKWPIVVRLAGRLGLRKLVDLPLAARDDLHQLLHFELDRLTPFKADDVCFAWRIQATDSKAERMSVALEMAPKIIVDRAVEIVSAHGREIDHVELDGSHHGDGPLDLLPRRDHEKASGSWLDRMLRIITLVLLILAIALPIRKQMAVVSELEADITVVRAKAEESLALRERLAFMSNEASFLAKARSGRPTMTEVLAELTNLLPDHSHIGQLKISDRSIDLNGFADKASILLAILDQSSMFASPRFKSPVTRDQRSGKERFQIAVELSERSL